MSGDGLKYSLAVSVILIFSVLFSCERSSPMDPAGLEKYTSFEKDLKAVDWDFIRERNLIELNTTTPLHLPDSAPNGTALEWSCEPEGIIDSGGYLLPTAYKAAPRSVTLTARLSSPRREEFKPFELSIPFVDYTLIEEALPAGSAVATATDLLNLQAAVDLAQGEGKPLYIGAGDYTLTGALVPHSGMTIAGSRNGLTILRSDTHQILINLTSGTLSNLLFENLVFINQSILLQPDSGTNIDFRNCIFIMNDFSLSNDMIRIENAEGITFTDCFILIHSTDIDAQTALNIKDSQNILISRSVFGNGSYPRQIMADAGDSRLNDRLLQLEWMEDKSYCPSEILVDNFDHAVRLSRDPALFDQPAQCRIYDNYFFGTGNAPHIWMERWNSAEIGGNYFHNPDATGSSIYIHDSQKIIYAMNHHDGAQFQFLSENIADPTNQLSDFYIAHNTVYDATLYFMDADINPVAVSNIVMAGNRFLTNNIIFLYDSNPSTGDYDASAFTIDKLNVYTHLPDLDLSIMVNGVTGSWLAPDEASVPAAVADLYRPWEYTRPEAVIP